MNDTNTPNQVHHLLLVDDNRLVLATLGADLRDAGYQVTTAESVADAEALLFGGLRPDLAVLDVRMSQGCGLDLALRLGELDRLPFIMLSAYSNSETVQRANTLGALAYMVKPVDAAQMAPTIEAALGRASDLRALRATTAQLQKMLNAERDIGVAVGITMAQHRLSRHAAIETLRQRANAQQRQLAELAKDAIYALELLGR